MSHASLENRSIPNFAPGHVAGTPFGADARRVAKRMADIAASFLLLTLLSPLFMALAMLIRADGGSAFYSHRRIGREGASFGCLKFRSMMMNGDARLAEHLAANPDAAAQWSARRKLEHDPRITRIGAFLRKTSLDELPQLLNVLRGEMSLVGPRPVVADELRTHYGRAGAAAYLAVTPGITGLWQVSGRSGTSYAERVALDMRYAERLSLTRDLHILLRTIPAVLARRGAV